MKLVLAPITEAAVAAMVVEEAVAAMVVAAMVVAAMVVVEAVEEAVVEVEEGNSEDIKLSGRQLSLKSHAGTYVTPETVAAKLVTNQPRGNPLGYTTD